MAVILWALGLSLLMQVCLCRPGQTARGCMTWNKIGDDVCCEACHPGNRLVNKCGPKPQELCKPCEPNTYTVEPLKLSCLRCTQCVGAQVLLRECTATTDTKCGCKEGLTCGNPACTFCVMKCSKGQEPTEDRSCRPCPEGTFNDQIHQKCKPLSAKCPNPDDKIVVKGNASADIECISVRPVTIPIKPDPPEQAWPLVLSVVTSIVLIVFGLIVVIIVVTLKIHQKRKKEEMENGKEKKTITPTASSDDPRTLIAIECSFHEAQQEQGSSSESLASKDSSERLIG
ncbi:tumor necrosis factor receptor superfamily member 9a [Pagrus major]|uniref:tumor necrosis factor receptor superfamily member 9a n=1 Tax=Pagrus major TaxID=143350 RepID=UPI003CC89BEF